MSSTLPDPEKFDSPWKIPTLPLTIFNHPSPPASENSKVSFQGFPFKNFGGGTTWLSRSVGDIRWFLVGGSTNLMGKNT